MNVSLSYTKGCIQHLAALAAACSKSVALYQNSNNDFTLSMGPYCKQITSQNSIVCYILNYNPIDEEISDNLLWQAKSIKSVLYYVYRNINSDKVDKAQLSTIEHVLKEINDKVQNTLKPQIRPLELVLWSDLYPILSGVLSIDQKLIPAVLSKWFTEMNKLIPLRTAVEISFGNDIASAILNNLKNVTHLPINIKSITNNSQKAHMETFFNSDSSISAPNVVPTPKLPQANCENALNTSAHPYSDNVPHLPINVKSINTNNLKPHMETFLNGHSSISAPNVVPTPKLPQPNCRNVLITSALPYVNNVPHLGNLIGSTLSADVFSRYCRLRGYNSIYVCGTDEYGTATEVKAASEKRSPREICDIYHAKHKKVYDWFQIDFDIFGRTSDDEHAALVTEVFNDIHKKGFILEDSVKQLYCEKCEMFLADRFVEGGCPSCGYEDARGDQCDKCTKLINAIELVKPRCKMCSSGPCERISKHLFLDFSTIQEQLEGFLNERMNAEDCIWPTNAKSITRDWLKKGLKPRCITRDLKWGVKVPLEEYKSKVFYVWFDAVLGYLSITSKYTPAWRQWWLPSEQSETATDVELFQFMAKDNVPFHSVMLPANLIATGRPYTMLKQLASVEYLNYEKDKFSKSRGVGVFGDDVDSTDEITVIPSDIWRFYLVSIRPESQDSAFQWDDFAAKNNNELLNNLGNFVNRALLFIVNNFNGVVPDYKDLIDESGGDSQFIEEVNEQTRKYVDLMERTKLKEALSVVLNISRLGNGYLDKNKPWFLIKEKQTRARAGAVVSIVANVTVLLGVLLTPIMPTTASKIFDQCQAPVNSRHLPLDCLLRAHLQSGHKIGAVTLLFATIDGVKLQKLKEKYGCATK